jgi:predicted  nucleic acid-binding Zn-ribbon protein
MTCQCSECDYYLREFTQTILCCPECGERKIWFTFGEDPGHRILINIATNERIRKEPNLELN